MAGDRSQRGYARAATGGDHVLEVALRLPPDELRPHPEVGGGLVPVPNRPPVVDVLDEVHDEFVLHLADLQRFSPLVLLVLGPLPEAPVVVVQPAQCLRAVRDVHVRLDPGAPLGQVERAHFRHPLR